MATNTSYVYTNRRDSIDEIPIRERENESILKHCSPMEWNIGYFYFTIFVDNHTPQGNVEELYN